MALASPRLLAGVDAAQAMDIVSVYEDRIVHTTMPITDAELLSGLPPAALARAAALRPEERRELLSRKDSLSRAAEYLLAGEAADGAAGALPTGEG